MAVDGLIIPRSYNDYINKTDPIALSQALKQNNALDDAPTEDSRGGVRSGGVYTALAGKQPTLTFDNTPTDGSSNPVTSDGIYDALAGKQDTLTFDDTPTADSDNPVKSSGLVNSVPVDEVTSSNMHAVTSNAVAGAIDTAKANIKFITSPSDTFSSFAALNAAIVNFTGFRFDSVSLSAEASDPDAPITVANYYWWNVITYGAASRKTQIAIQAYNKGFSTAGYMFVRTYHDETWSAWFQK